MAKKTINSNKNSDNLNDDHIKEKQNNASESKELTKKVSKSKTTSSSVKSNSRKRTKSEALLQSELAVLEPKPAVDNKVQVDVRDAPKVKSVRKRKPQGAIESAQPIVDITASISSDFQTNAISKDNSSTSDTKDSKPATTKQRTQRKKNTEEKVEKADSGDNAIQMQQSPQTFSKTVAPSKLTKVKSKDDTDVTANTLPIEKKAKNSVDKKEWTGGKENTKSQIEEVTKLEKTPSVETKKPIRTKKAKVAKEITTTNANQVDVIKLEPEAPRATTISLERGDEATSVIQPGRVLSKSAQRRAKKKAKKIREQQALLQQQALEVQAVLEESEVLPKQKPQVQEFPGKPQRHNARKSKNKSRNAYSQQNIAPIYSNDNSTAEKKDTTASQPQYVSHRKLHPKPIPWTDLSKLQNERKDVTVPKTTEVEEIVPINSSMLLTPAQRRDPFFQNFYRDIERFAISEMLIENGSKVVVAVSGGVDSVVLLDVFANLAAKYNFVVYVAHYNHNLRGEASNNDAKFVRSLAASYNIPFYTASGKIAQYAQKTGMSVEEAARFLRYHFFERTACTIKADFVATAHTADDSAETFLLNLFRGTGLTGLSGIPSRRQLIKDVIIIRPFLNFSKQKLIAYAEKRNLSWTEDESNLQDKYTRNKIRNDLIPKLKNDYSTAIVDIINRSSKLIQGADRIIHSYVRTHLASVLLDISNESVSIKLALFKTFDEFIRGEMLQTILMKYFKLLPLSMKIIDRIIKLEQSEVGAICEISSNIVAIKDRQVIVITKKNTPSKINQKIEKTGKFILNDIAFVLKEIEINDVEYNKNPNVEYFDASLLSNILTIRNWEHGDDFIPLGMENNMKLSDFLVNEKISILDKPNVIVLTTNSNEIIWVCKYRISNKYKITDKTKKVIRIEIKEKSK